jgi:beta-phosphoglucomutase-like phosphatase (HAD superfamily)
MEYEYIAGFEPFVTALRKQGIKTAVVTSSNLEKMANVYRHRPEMKDYFDAILTSEDFERSKARPRRLSQGCGSLWYRPERMCGV